MILFSVYLSFNMAVSGAIRVSLTVIIFTTKGQSTMPRTGENIYKRKDGRWEARFIFAYNTDGKARYKHLYAKTYSEVKAKLIKAQNSEALKSQERYPYDSETYERWLFEWLKSKKVGIKASTYIRYRNIVKNHIVPELGKYPIGKITTPLIEGFVFNKLSCGRLDGKGGLSSKTISDILTIIKESFEYAQASGILSVCNFDRICLKQSSHEMRVLSVSEQQMLLSVLFKDFDRYKLGVFICLYTGIRIGELCALQWRNISFNDKTLRIESTLQRLQCEDSDSPNKTKIIVTEPKSNAARRTIPLPDFLIEAIKPFAGAPNMYVVSGKSKFAVEPRTMQNRFKKYLDIGKIESANFHSLRHTFATRCVEAGFDIKTLSEILGHSSVKITLDRYVHSSMEQKRHNMAKLSLALR